MIFPVSVRSVAELTELKVENQTLNLQLCLACI